MPRSKTIRAAEVVAIACGGTPFKACSTPGCAIHATNLCYPVKPSEVLRAARETLAVPGVWVQGNPTHRFADTDSADQCECLSTAIGQMRRARKFARRVLADGVLTEWNDAPGRTLPEVLDVLQRAAELAESEGQ